jgi:CheY-like chemotaxis protein
MARHKNNHENNENNRKTILIVDDEETLTWSMSKNLSMNKQYKVICANSAEEALQILKEVSSIDLIVSDIKMEGMSGFELLDYVKINNPRIGFIIMTAYGSDENKQKALEKGALRYIEKPFGMRSMIRTIGEVLGEMEQLLKPQEQLKSKVKNQVQLTKILSDYTQDIKELIFIKLNARDGEVLFQAGSELIPTSQKDMLSSIVVNKIGEICKQLTMGESELIAISTEKYYVLLKPLADQKLFLYSLIAKKLGFGKSLYFMEHLTAKVCNVLKLGSDRRRKDHAD